MFRRLIAKELKDSAKKYPVVTLIGPRQSGKTTLVRIAFPKKPYVNLEAPDTREMAEVDPRGFLQLFPKGAILDEIQRVPSLLSYIQVMVDETATKGLFILTGSHQLQLHAAISQSLAGRTSILTLLPLSLVELEIAKIDQTLDETLLYGGYPRIFHDKLDPTKAYRNYFQTYIERDVRQLINVRDLLQFQKFIRLCAGRIGQLLNLESLGNEVGLTSHTVKHWISLLEASYVLFRLPPYFENFGKRLIKSNKLYFTDVGLASYLLGIENVNQMKRDPLRGNLFENLMVIELLKGRLNQGLEPGLYFFRDAHGNEVDLIYQKANELIGIEVKSSMTFTSEFLKNLRFFQKVAGKRNQSNFIIYTGEREQEIEGFSLINYKRAIQVLF